MELIRQALRAGNGGLAEPAAARRSALLVGAGGSLGTAVLERALSAGVFVHVQVLVDAPVAPALRGFRTLDAATLVAGAALGADTAFIVFDRARHAHGREEAFHRPQPAALPALASALRRGGVARLVIVLPHAPALLPQALKAGLASLDEQAVAALHFEHLVIVRSAQEGAGGALAGPWLQRVADGVLAQLRWMIPQREQPLRPVKVAQFALDVADRLPQAAPGTRVAPAELLWAYAQPGGGAPLVAAWLAGEIWPEPTVPKPRL